MATLDVITLAEAKVALHMGATTANDTELTAMITAISQRLDLAVGPIVTRTVTAETYDGSDTLGGTHGVSRASMIQLKSWPCTAVTTVVESGTTLTVTTDYVADLEKGQLWRRIGAWDYLWRYGRDNIAVTYTAGRFANTAAVDEWYKQGAYLMLQHHYRARQWNVGPLGGGDFQVPQIAFPAYSVPNAVVEWFGTEWRDTKRGGFA